MSSNAEARTRGFARVIGPFLVLGPGIVAIRAPTLGPAAVSFFAVPALVWIMGALLLGLGLAITAFHQYWRRPSAVIISLFGWFLALRGVALLLAPQVYQEAVSASSAAILPVRLGFAVLVAAGAWLTYVGWRPARATEGG